MSIVYFIMVVAMARFSAGVSRSHSSEVKASMPAYMRIWPTAFNSSTDTVNNRYIEESLFCAITEAVGFGLESGLDIS